jgi:magnesium chelatase family protein
LPPSRFRLSTSRRSFPLLDRIDIHVEVPAISYDELTSLEPGEPSVDIRDRVVGARNIQQQRFARTIADLDHAPAIGAEHIAEAIQYRTLDRQTW